MGVLSFHIPVRIYIDYQKVNNFNFLKENAFHLLFSQSVKQMKTGVKIELT